MKKANLFFKDGTILMVPVHSDRWPDTIDHQRFIHTGAPLLALTQDAPAPVTNIITVRFYYYGVQDGVAAYVERPDGTR